jgi:hypothetical protein
MHIHKHCNSSMYDVHKHNLGTSEVKVQIVCKVAVDYKQDRRHTATKNSHHITFAFAASSPVHNIQSEFSPAGTTE